MCLVAVAHDPPRHLIQAFDTNLKIEGSIFIPFCPLRSVPDHFRHILRNFLFESDSNIVDRSTFGDDLPSIAEISFEREIFRNTVSCANEIQLTDAPDIKCPHLSMKPR